jgi:hypothetical protein
MSTLKIRSEARTADQSRKSNCASDGLVSA